VWCDGKNIRAGGVTMERSEIDRLLRELYAARARSDLDAICRIFTDDAIWRVAGASRSGQIAIVAHGGEQIRSWLALMLKTFQLSDLEILSTIIDGARAAGHWRARIHSRITGADVPTELVDLIEVRDGRIRSYTEFFVPC
jgi:ketosteroid isomerase-like protein